MTSPTFSEPATWSPPIVFSRGRGLGITYLLIGAALSIAGILVGMYAFPPEHVAANVLAGGTIALIGLAMMGIGLKHHLQSRFAYAFDGRTMAVLSWKGTRTVDYSEIESIAYIQKGISRYGLTGSSELVLIIRLREGRKAVLRCDIVGFEESFDIVRDHLSAVLAQRMIGILATGREVPWADGVVFSPNGIRHEKGLVPWRDIVHGEFDYGFFRLHARGQDNATVRVLSVEIVAENFLPGLLVIKQRVPDFIWRESLNYAH